MITNKYGLPAPLVRAIENDSYSKGESDISVTTLIQPPQMRKLMQGVERVEDASDCIFRLLGQAVHAILEMACPGTSIAEQRVFSEVSGWVVSGQFDLLEDHTLNDYKVTTVYAREGKIEWDQQINLLAALLRRPHYLADGTRRSGVPMSKGQIVAIFRDWRPMERFNQDDYPETQVGLIPVPLWPEAEAEAYLHERVRLHQMDNPPPCTDAERWMSPEKWALMQGETESWVLMKEGGKRAIRVFDIKPELELKPGQFWDKRKNEASQRAIKLYDAAPQNVTLNTGQYIEHRPGAYRRCESYCAAAEVCPQLKQEAV